MVLTADATKAPHELGALLALVGDDLQRGPEGLVVVGEPLQQRLALHQLQLHAALKHGHRGSITVALIMAYCNDSTRGGSIVSR